MSSQDRLVASRPALEESPDLSGLGFRSLTGAHGLESGPSWSLYREATRTWWRAARRALFHSVIPSKRTQQVVRSHYDHIWSPDNAAFVRERDNVREIYRHGTQLVRADGWHLYQAYIELISETLVRLGASSVLEVGAGRGKNLALLALKNPHVKLTGIELTPTGVARSRELVAAIPEKFLTVAGVSTSDARNADALRRIEFVEGSALAMPFADRTFDASFTCLVLEQLQQHLPQVLTEMRRVTSGYCVFIEAFHEANTPLGRAYLRSRDYFRARYRSFAEHGLEPVYFTTAMPQKLRFRTGLLVARVRQ